MADKTKAITEILGRVPQAISLGLAIVDREGWTLIFENENFFK